MTDKERGVKSSITVTPDSIEEEPTERSHSAALEEMRAAQAAGAPIPDAAIKEAEEAIAKGSNDYRESSDSDNDLDVELGDGSIWNPETNPIKFNDWFEPETTQSLNNFLWELKNKVRMIEDEPEEFVDEMLNVFPALMFILLPIFAIILKIMYIFKKRYYMEHLIIALHSHSFIFFSLLMIFIVTSLDSYVTQDSWYSDTLSLIFVALIIWIPINLFLQQKRVYAQGKFFTTIKFILVGITYMALLGVTAASAAVVGLVNL